MSNVASLPHQIRVGVLLPKVLGVLWERGIYTEPEHPRLSGVAEAQVGAVRLRAFWLGDVEDAAEIGAGITAYVSAQQVFCASIDEKDTDCGYSCDVHYWARGDWEQVILAEASAPLEMDRLIHGLCNRAPEERATWQI